MDIKLNRLDRTEWVGMAAAILLFLSTFMPWFETDPENPNSKIQGVHGGPDGGAFNVWQSFDVVQYILVLCCLAPFVLAWIVVRDHEVGWELGEMTGIFGAIALTVVILNSVIFGQPGTVETTPTWGVLVAAFASTVILFAGAMRAYKNKKPEPPGI